MEPSSSPLIIVGAGMHGRIVRDIAMVLGIPVAGFLDDVQEPGARVDDLTVIGRTDRLDDGEFLSHHRFVIAIGNNIARRRFATRVRNRGGQVATLVLPGVFVSPTATIGSGTVVVGANMVFSHARIGEDVLVDPDATIGADSVIGDGVYLCPGCHLASGVTCLEESFVGIGAVVVPNVTIGRRSIVGAGAVVIRDVPDGKLAIGNPARVTGDAVLDDFSPYPARSRPRAGRDQHHR
jgi:sugar O-acyltransferase (sialic acid O-acetyltransferase NeuD family)